MKATQQLDFKKIFICFDESEIRVCHGSYGDKQDILEKNNILNIQSFEINNPKLNILLIKQKLTYLYPIIYLFTDVCTKAIEKMRQIFPKFFCIQIEVNKKDNENDDTD